MSCVGCGDNGGWYDDDQWVACMMCKTIDCNNPECNNGIMKYNENYSGPCYVCNGLKKIHPKRLNVYKEYIKGNVC